MNTDDETFEVHVNRNALRNLLVKAVGLIILVVGPILILGLLNPSLEQIIGVADPSSPGWIGLSLAILLWYVVTFALLVPALKRIVDSRIPP